MRVINMKRINWLAVIAGISLCAILFLAGTWLVRPGITINIPGSEGEILPPAEVVFVTPEGSKFHREGCSALKKSETVWRLTPDAAEADGYEACQRCKPK